MQRSGQPFFPVALILAVTFAPIVGCSWGSPKALDMGGEEGKAIADLIESLNDYKATDSQIAAVYMAQGPIPKSDELNLYAFYISGKPKVEGSTATCKVVVEKMDGTPVGEREWRFTKADGKWKIESSPL